MHYGKHIPLSGPLIIKPGNYGLSMKDKSLNKEIKSVKQVSAINTESFNLTQELDELFAPFSTAAILG